MSNLSNLIFAADDIESELVEVKPWGVTVLVKSMTARDRAKMIGDSVENNGAFRLEEVLPDLVILCTFDPETGEKVFADNDRDALMAKSAAPIEQIATVAMRLSGMDEDAVDEAGKDSSPTVTADSSLS
jgi:hypothetical protein